MKAIINKILHWLKYSVITLMLALVLIMSVLYFASPFFERYRPDFEQFVSKLILKPVKIGSISIRSRGLEPIFIFHNIVIFDNDNDKKLLQARELQVGVDLVRSLLKLQIKPGLLLIRGSEFTVQTKDDKISLVGIPLASDTGVSNTDSILDEISLWLSEQTRIDLDDIRLKWYLADGKVIKITNLHLKLHNGVIQHSLQIDGKFEQKNHIPAIFKADIRLRGNISGEVVIENLFHKIDTWQFSGNSFAMPLSGDISFIVKNSHIETKYLRQPLLIKNLSGTAVWSHVHGGLKLNISKLNFLDDWLSIHGGGELQFLAGSEMPVADMKLDFKLINLAKAKLYYPVTLLPPDATVWLDNAFVHSKLITGDMILRGPLDKFPFDNNEGKFLVNTDLRDVHLNYDADWPHIENIDGKMIFANRSLTILAKSAKIIKEQVKAIKVIIKDLDLPILDVDGVMETSSKAGLKFVNLCPLKNTIGRKLQSINLVGPMKLSLKMLMPLSDDILEKDTEVNGEIELSDNKVRVDGLGFEINNLKGLLSFSEDDLTATELSGSLFDKPVKIDIDTLDSSNGDVVTQVKIGGSAKVQDFEQALAVSLNPYVFGEFDYNVLLELHGSSKQNVFKLDSNLHGVTVDLPSPFDKKSDSDYKFNCTCYFDGNKLPQLFINYNDQINSALMIKKSDDNSFKVVAGEIKFGATPAKITAVSGLLITGNVSKLDWSVWKEYLVKTKADSAVVSSIIRQISLSLGELNVLGKTFKKMSLKAIPKINGWEFTLLTPYIDGKIYIPNNLKACIRGTFKKLHFIKEQQNSYQLKPQELSPLNFIIDDFQYGDKNFSKVELVADPQLNGLKINKLILNNTTFRIETNGDWFFLNGNQQSVFHGKISSTDIGGLLKRWDFTDNMVGGNGFVDFVLKWDDSPYDPSLTKIKGALGVHINNGRIINLGRETENKLGFGRVLNMLSLQSLPQRLTLDFSDLHQGFSFNTMDGEVEVTNGNALVKKLILDGQVAYIRAYGRIGLKDQDYDMMLSVVPHHITSSILPVAGTITGGPVGGVLGFVADKIISLGIKKTVRNTYHITGSWDNPKVEKA